MIFLALIVANDEQKFKEKFENFINKLNWLIDIFSVLKVQFFAWILIWKLHKFYETKLLKKINYWAWHLPTCESNERSESEKW